MINERDPREKRGKERKKSIIQRFLTCAARVSIDLVKIEPLFRLHKQLERHKKRMNIASATRAALCVNLHDYKVENDDDGVGDAGEEDER